MTPEERRMLTDLANRIAQTPSPARDPEAEDFIRTHIGSRPDALYLMTQTVLVQNMALEHARQEIEQLRQELQNPAQQQRQSSSFLGQPQAPSAWSSPPPPPPQGYAPAPPAGGGGMSSFLRSAGTTAAGIAAGALAFEGIRSLFGGAEHMFGHPSMGSSFLGGAAPGETTINNFYDGSEGRSGNSALGDELGPDDSAQYDDDDTSTDDDVMDDDVTDNDSSSDDLV